MKAVAKLAMLVGISCGPTVLGAAEVATAATHLPTSVEECQGGGWRDFGVFKNQGDCVAFVASRGKNPPLEPTELFAEPAYYPPGQAAFMTSGDFNADGAPDLAVTNPDQGVAVLLNDGDGNLSASGGNRTAYPAGIGAADFDGDTDVDLVVTDTSTRTVSVLFNEGDGTFARRTSTEVDGARVGIAVEDFNGDGHPDVAVASSGGAAVLLHV